MTFKTLATAIGITLTGVSSAAAATFNMTGSFTGAQLGDVAFDINITADFSGDIAVFAGTSDGLTINSLTSSIVAGDPFLAATLPLQYYYDADRVVANGDAFVIGGGSPGSVSGATTDFWFEVTNLFTTPEILSIRDSISTSVGRNAVDPATATFTITEISAVPLPAGGWLLIAGLGGLGALRHRAAKRS